MRWFKTLFTRDKTATPKSTASTAMAKPTTRYGSTRKRDVSYFVARENEEFSHLYSIFGLLKRMDKIDEKVASLPYLDMPAIIELQEHLKKEHAHVLEMIKRMEIGTLGGLRFELGDLDKLLIDTLAEIRLRTKEGANPNSGGELTPITEDQSQGSGEDLQSDIKSKIELYSEEIEYIIENLHQCYLQPIGIHGTPLQFYFLRAHSAIIDDEYLYGKFKSVDLGSANSEQMLSALLNGPDFSSPEQSAAAFGFLVEELINLIRTEGKRLTVHPDDQEMVNIFRRLLKVMDKETLTSVFNSRELSMKERIEKIITEAFASETSHLKMRLEEKKPFLRSKFLDASRSEYDEYGEPVWKDVHGSVREMLMGINLRKGYTGTFRLFSDPENDLVEHALHHMEAWVTDDLDEPMPSDGFEFEKWVAGRLNNHGWIAYATSGSGDQGVDVVAEKNGLTVGIQCKRYSGSVGNKAVQEIHAGVRHMGLDRAAVISNAEFTKSARELSGTTGTLLLSVEAIPDLYDLLTQTSNR